MEGLVTCKGNSIYAIIGRDEIQSCPSCDKPYNYVKEFPNYLCFITISDPDKQNIDDENYFLDTLKLKFWDVEEEIGRFAPIHLVQAKEIYNFIMKNRNSEFLINCEAGVSRSAAIGLAIEYLLRDFELYPKWEQFPSKVLQHWRYCPNMTVFEQIISFHEVK